MTRYFPRILIALACFLSACRTEAPTPIQVVVGQAQSERAEFVPKAAFAEYIELAGLRNELRITLASYAASCERFISPPANETSVTITVITPPGQKPVPASYPWGEIAADAGVRTPGNALSQAVARIGKKSFAFPPGGTLELSKAELSQDGEVRGILAFEFPGTAGQPATSLKGSFAAKICLVSLSPH